ncbi:MAG: radical SAM family heme chaperone HemW [Gammaproteobacteria bacterium]|nr:radical SAM family heme chaperone HemW [Gammaproteobacteria bacterium]
MLESPPLSLYVHLPWCVHKCPYCDFNSHVQRGVLPEGRYIDALIADLELDLATVSPRPLQSIFLGGGTPSLFAAEAIARLFEAVRLRVPCSPSMEVTLEANPGTIERGRFAEYRSAGVTRLSIGAQSFDDRHLRALGRIHTARETRAAVAEAQAAGFDDFNLDLMYGLPDQTRAEALADVEAALELAPSHLSHYELTIEPNTRFHRRPPSLPDDDTRFAMLTVCQARLAGFEHYEVSAFAVPGRRCRHNVNYWSFGDYLGIGAGAHAKLTDTDSGRVWRTAKLRHPLMYMRHAHDERRIAVRREVGSAERAFEFMLNALRMPDGFTRQDFEARTGLELERIEAALETGCARGLLGRVGAAQWAPTDRGLLFLNDLQALFLPGGPADNAGRSPLAAEWRHEPHESRSLAG